MAESHFQLLAEEQPEQLAALDLGSNSFHLLVVQVVNGRVQVLDKLKEMVRLAEGLDAHDDISEPVARRALECLERFGQRLRELPPRNVRVVGTNTLRRANNAQDFIRRAEAALGHAVEIISGREEARLIYLGVSNSLQDDHDRRLVIDIGGGSTELILGRRFQPEVMESLFMGCVGVSRSFFADGRIRATQFQQAVDHARLELEPIERAYSEHGWDTVIGASGTILATRDILRAMNIDQTFITLDGLDTIRSALLESKTVDTLELPGLPQERAAVFPGGFAILCAIFEQLGIRQMHVSNGALREGVIYDLLGRAQHQDVRESTVRDLIGRYHIDEKHARRVRDTAIALLAQVADAWSLTRPNDKPLLAWAAELHEIGMDIAHTQYHKHGGYLLQHMDMPGFSNSDQQQLAALVRAHRRKFPIAEPMFTGPARERMIRLAALLRIATVLHRNRVSRALPHVALKVHRQHVNIALPESWLRRNALTRLDLQQEAAFLAAAELELTITNR
jgi:exopolyphosphatase/guanosine-5'-triphosphate,3'-diphosphate pyrophosphatase